MTLGESPWHAYCSNSVLGPVGSLNVLTLILTLAQHHGWFRSERCRSSNVDALPGSPWHVLCCPSVLRAVGYLTLNPNPKPDPHQNTGPTPNPKLWLMQIRKL